DGRDGRDGRGLTRLKAAARHESPFGRHRAWLTLQIKFGIVACPVRDALGRMTIGLGPEVSAHIVQTSGSDARYRITLRPAQWGRAGWQRPVRDRRTTTLQTLDQAAERSGGVHPHKQMDMGGDHADFQDVGTVMPGSAAKKSAQELGPVGGDELRSVSRGPDQMQVQAMMHG
ncbi:MAG TPA: hypothetical protein VFM12_07950, partial [Gemmatimonadales bacterium]|nr:hypothetical protein [Gemmatimonadales bacterium]